ncbi:MAG: CcmD family protein [Thermodesulfobacteriota bacterium]
MVSGTHMLLAANILVWSGVALYVWGLGRRSARLEKRMRQLEISSDRDTQSE